MPAPGVLSQTPGVSNTDYDGTPAHGPKIFWHQQISTDGGRTWRAVTNVTQPVTEVPPGGFVKCIGGNTEEACTLVAVDPVTARAAPLATPPPLYVDAAEPLTSVVP